MMIAIVGPASCLAYQVIDTVSSFMRQYVGQTSHIVTNDPLELRHRLESRSEPNVIINCTEPSEDMLGVFKRTKLPIAIVIDDPYDYTAYIVDTIGTPWPGAYRAYMRALCQLQPIIGEQGVVMLRRVERRKNVENWLRSLTQLFKITVSPDEIGDFVRKANAFDRNMYPSADGASEHRVRSGEAFRDALSEVERIEIDTALEDYLITLYGRKLRKISWKRQLFSSHDLPFGINVIRIDTTGKARHLVFGPYFYIPRGNWQAILRVAAEKILSGCEVLIDVCAIEKNEILFEGEIQAPLKNSAHSCVINFTINDATTPIEIRIYMKSGSIEGYFSFGDVDLIMVDD